VWLCFAKALRSKTRLVDRRALAAPRPFRRVFALENTATTAAIAKTE
jgi:hypothetical protein